MIKTKQNLIKILKASTLVITFLIFTTSCARSCGFCPVEDATQAVIFGAAELKKRQELTLEDSCINYDHGITQLNVTFISQDTVDLCEARFILYDVVETYLRYFNDPVIFLPELRSPPFGPENLNIIITFESYYGRFVDLQYINQIRMYNGCVTYYDFNAFDPFGDVFHQQKEYYNNTRLIVNAQTSSRYPVAHGHSELYKTPENASDKNLKNVLASSKTNSSNGNGTTNGSLAKPTMNVNGTTTGTGTMKGTLVKTTINGKVPANANLVNPTTNGNEATNSPVNSTATSTTEKTTTTSTKESQ